MHLERLEQRLRAEGHRPTRIAPQGGRERHVVVTHARVLVQARGDVLHAHVLGIPDKLFLGSLARLGRAVVLTVHGQSLEDEIRRASRPVRRLAIAALRGLPALIAVNERIRSFAVDELGLRSDRVLQIPAFLPPAPVTPGTPIAPEAEALLARCDPVVCANAFHLSLYEGAPLYGADLLVEMLARSRESHPRLGAVLYLSTLAQGDDTRLAALHEHARALGVGDRFVVVTGSQPFNPVLVRSRAMIRPTVVDGDAVSVRDALWLGVPVIASDAVARPEGTRLFASRDADDLWRVLRDVLDGRPSVPGDDAAGARRDPYPEIRDLYLRIASRRR